ncbi:MAG: PilT/PilU family type 4a pilus ATPase [Deltaproteobacteria bacterium]|nr:PilT/PilU family type 4a pilus ATPase [Deltaproteobacteria bacterium]
MVMLSRTEVLATFKAAPWKRAEEVEAFVADAEQLLPADLLKLLEQLSGKVADPNTHKARLLAFLRLTERFPDRALFAPFVKAVRTGDPGLRAVLAQALVKVNSPSEHADACLLLRDKDPGVRQAAQKALVGLRASRGIFETLSRLLQEKEFPGRLEAFEVLASFAGSQAIPVLLSALPPSNPGEKLVAIKLLADPRVSGKDVATALKALVGVLQTETGEPMLGAIAAFASLCTEEDFWEFIGPILEAEPMAPAKAAIEAVRRFNSPRTIAALEKRMRLGPRALRLAVLNTLEAIGTDDVLPPLIEALSHKQLPVRTRAAEVLQALGIARKIDLSRTIVWLLRSRDVNVRRLAAESIRSVPDPDESLWPKLLLLLRDEDWWVRERVMDALVDLGGQALTRHMVSYLTDPSEVVRRFAVRVLARLKDVRGLRALIELAQKDNDWWVRESAIEAIAAIGDPRAVPYIVQFLATDESLHAVCVDALIELKALAALPHIAGLLASTDPDARLSAVRGLDALDGKDYLEQVRALATDFDGRVKAESRRLLFRWQSEAQGGIAAGTPVLDRFLIQLARTEGDDLLLAGGRPVVVKRLGHLVPILTEPLSAEQVRAILAPHLSPEQSAELDKLHDVDFSYEVKSEGLRFRANVFHELGGLCAVFRRIRGHLPEFEALGLPAIVKTFGDLKNGLVLVGGPTGAGKSTTLAAIIDYINRTSSRHIVCLEDPIEVVHKRKLSLVNQREIGTHTRDYKSALRATLRQDPDVILVGELRDLETIAFTAVAAETGHLVFGTVHTASVATSLDRLVNAFPAGEQEQVRATLAQSLRAVLCQYLLPDRSRDGARVLATEVLLNNDAVSNLIRKGKSFQIPSVIATSREMGMQLMDQDLLRLFREGRISAEHAYVKAQSKKEFEALFDEERGIAKANVRMAPLTRAKDPKERP